MRHDPRGIFIESSMCVGTLHKTQLSEEHVPLAIHFEIWSASLHQVVSMGLPASRMRFLALSATLPNATDIGAFVGAEVFRFGPEYRPVPLEVSRQHFLNYAAVIEISPMPKELGAKEPATRVCSDNLMLFAGAHLVSIDLSVMTRKTSRVFSLRYPCSAPKRRSR